MGLPAIAAASFFLFFFLWNPLPCVCVCTRGLPEAEPTEGKQGRGEERRGEGNRESFDGTPHVWCVWCGVDAWKEEDAGREAENCCQPAWLAGSLAGWRGLAKRRVAAGGFVL